MFGSLSIVFVASLFIWQLVLEYGMFSTGFWGRICVPGVTKGCFLEAFEYLKTSKNTPCNFWFLVLSVCPGVWLFEVVFFVGFLIWAVIVHCCFFLCFFSVQLGRYF